MNDDLADVAETVVRAIEVGFGLNVLGGVIGNHGEMNGLYGFQCFPGAAEFLVTGRRCQKGEIGPAYEQDCRGKA